MYVEHNCNCILSSLSLYFFAVEFHFEGHGGEAGGVHRTRH
jgi:hypothetical protein